MLVCLTAQHQVLARMDLPFWCTLLMKPALSIVLTFSLTLFCAAQEKPKAKPVELEVLKESIGVWDAEIEVWPQGPDSDSIKSKGVETNRAYGEYWIASDFDSQFGGRPSGCIRLSGATWIRRSWSARSLTMARTRRA